LHLRRETTKVASQPIESTLAFIHKTIYLALHL